MTTQQTSQWAIDPAHSEITFKVKHLVVTTLTGKFDKFEASVSTHDDQFEQASVQFSADIDSINTGNADRDGHLKSEDFFNAAAFPKLTFAGGSLVGKGDDKFELTGDLTIRDVTQKVTLQVELGGVAVDPWGNTKAGFEITGKISRKSFGLKWDAFTEAGGAVVSDEVKLALNVQLVKQA
ncbi:MAG: YceI family protein [Bacteroidia bacterium]|jgi:polyisoprenoid-binding protein YceI|nr:YceI family protein [Bacteroidia bacterium]